MTMLWIMDSWCAPGNGGVGSCMGPVADAWGDAWSSRDAGSRIPTALSRPEPPGLAAPRAAGSIMPDGAALPITPGTHRHSQYKSRADVCLQIYLALHPAPQPMFHYFKAHMLAMQPGVSAGTLYSVGSLAGDWRLHVAMRFKLLGDPHAEAWVTNSSLDSGPYPRSASGSRLLRSGKQESKPSPLLQSPQILQSCGWNARVESELPACDDLLAQHSVHAAILNFVQDEVVRWAGGPGCGIWVRTPHASP